jgi:hypothetical protein
LPREYDLVVKVEKI